MGCLDKAAIASYLAGDLPPDEHQAAEVHLDDCVQCLGLLSELTQRPEQAAEIAAAGKFNPATTQIRPIGADQGAKLLWLERHYNIQIGDVVDGKFKIEKILGEGGMGIVLRATHVALRERVAIKLMHPTMINNPKHTARFRREARAAVKLRDENVARILDLGELPEVGPFIIMEFLEGEDLLKYLKANAPLPIAEAVELIRQAAAGVSVAHGAGIVHRDLKPGNMFLTERADGSRVLKVLDFGVSKYIEGDSLSVTATNMVVGSPMYMAPEMFESARNGSPASDVWAIGIIFYRMLTGRLPFFAESLPEMVAKIHFGQPTPLTHWRPELPYELSQIIAGCLARQPSDRFSSAREFLNALAQLPARIRADPHAPTVAVAHLSREISARPESTSSSGPFRALPEPSGPIARAQETEARPKRSPWLFALVGAAASAALFAGIMAATRSDGRQRSTEADPAAASAPENAVPDLATKPAQPPASSPPQAAVSAPTPALSPDAGAQRDAGPRPVKADVEPAKASTNPPRSTDKPKISGKSEAKKSASKPPRTTKPTPPKAEKKDPPLILR